MVAGLGRKQSTVAEERGFLENLGTNLEKAVLKSPGTKPFTSVLP